MTIKIVTDSTCDLPPDVTAKHDITVVPLYVNMGDRGYLDGVDLTRDEFYKRLLESKIIPTTAAPGTEMFRKTYEELSSEHLTGILSIHVSGSLSTTLNNARLGAAEVTSTAVTVFDSGQLSLGLGFLVVAAAEAAAEGQPLEAIKTRLNEQKMRTHLFAVLDDLEFLRRSGRVNDLLAGLGSVLQIKPVFKVYNGRASYDRVRTHKRALKRLTQLLDEQGPLAELCVVHSNVPDRAEQLRDRVSYLRPEAVIPLIDVSPIIATHIGPNAVGIVGVAASGDQ